MAELTLLAKIEASVGGFVSGMKEATEAFEGLLKGLATGDLTEIGKGITGLIEQAGPLALVAGGVLAIHEAFDKLKESVLETEQLNIAVGKLAKQMATTQEEASVISEALKDRGLETSSYTTALNFLTKAMGNNSVGFKNLGVSIREPNGDLRDAGVVMQEAIDKFDKMEDGTKKTIIGQQIFGRSFMKNRDFLQLTSAALKETSEHMDELGTKTTPETERASRKFQLALADVKNDFEAFAINLGNKIMPALTDLFIWLDGVGIAAVQAFRAALTLLGDYFDYIAKVTKPFVETIKDLAADIGGDLMSAAKDFADTFSKVFGDSGLDVLKIFDTALKTVYATFAVIVEVVKILWDVASLVFKQMTDALFGIGTAIVQVIHGDYTDAMNTVKTTGHLLVDDAEDTSKKIGNSWEALSKRLAALSAPDLGPVVDQPKEQRKKGGGANVDTGKDKSGEMVKEWKEALNELKLEEDNWFNFSTAREIAFWEDKLAQTKKGTNAYRAVLGELARLKKTAATEERTIEGDKTKEDLAESNRAADAKVTAIQNSEKRQIDALKEGAAEAALIAKGKIEVAKLEDPDHASKLELAAIREEMAAQDKLAAEIAAIRAKDLADELSVLDEKIAAQHRYFAELRDEYANDAKMQAKIDADETKQVGEALKEEKKLEDQNRLELQKAEDEARKRKLQLDQAADKQVATDRAKLTKQIEGYLQPFVKGFSDGIKKMLQGTLSLGDAIKGLGQMVVGAITDMIGQMVEVWIQGLAKMLAQWLSNLLIQKTTQQTADATTAATAGAARSAQVLGYAAEAAAAAGASVAAIPFVGWAMIPEVMAATFGAVAAMAAPAAAAGGFDVPMGLNPMTQLHSEEMVLPAPLANAVRSMAAPGQGTDNTTGGGDVHVHISAVDSQGVARLFQKHDSPISKALKGYARQGKFSK